ncbi:hypothetical protein C9374_006499 [Naegleria lovaniensis]|uniref:Uncharacterized protein n=1 Tax=Naegleria lovaniensis TaxID=51637 RepID=A0AA88GP63_NAELO|nr:uncharacterized protein C9374_006499 [Naegleria lovaniensis]KAG2381510.1 hypothetical protein C9374_006499 [Naegleria lovaniensis]
MSESTETTPPTIEEILRVRDRLEQLISLTDNKTRRFAWPSDDEMYSESEKKFYLYLGMKINFSDLFFTMCLQKEAIGTPPCLKKYENLSLLEHQFSAKERKELFSDLLSCAYMSESPTKQPVYQFYDKVALDRYLLIREYENQFIYQPGSLKTMPSLYHAFTTQIPDPRDKLEGDNMDQLTEEDISKLKILFQKFNYEKQFNHILQDYQNISKFPPLFLAFANTACIPYCRKHVMNCLRNVLEIRNVFKAKEMDDSAVLDQVTLEEAYHCLYEPCCAKVSNLIDHVKNMETKSKI